MTEIIETTENMTPPTSNNSNGMSNKLFWVLLGALGLILAGLLFYFFYWIKTPTYTVGIIKTAIEQKDMTAFEKHVDLDALLGKAYLDSTRAGLAKPDAEESKELFQKSKLQPAPKTQLLRNKNLLSLLWNIEALALPRPMAIQPP